MAKDVTPDHLKIANHNFATETQEEVAKIIDEEWDPDTTLKDLHKAHEGKNRSESMFGKVYKRYMAIDDDKQFNDGLNDPRTIQEIKKDHGKVKTYIDDRYKGRITKDDYRPYLPADELEPRDLSESEPEPDEPMVSMEQYRTMMQEMYRQGFQDGKDANQS
ncbi:hypothetical protein [Natrialba taiwanensis]|uniref:Uncharacterized protein n=1 Tax=Natrialba taiwanensis DSM 12281 TaxID=1230458 RepID=L9ZZE2_9EURY|nr:hypothetical protein [Natrialba taiwanensis]ELY91441.1 hypothetical protein C484_10451 [Natrialba taiwanensis DSM 12281]